jgi:hypothetical protein
MKFEYLIKTLETCLLYADDNKKKLIKKQIKNLKNSL